MELQNFGWCNMSGRIAEHACPCEQGYALYLSLLVSSILDEEKPGSINHMDTIWIHTDQQTVLMGTTKYVLLG